MIESIWGLLAVGAMLASVAMGLLWALQVRIHDASHVDVAWAILIACAALAYAVLADGDVAHRVLAAVLASIWGFRLGLYLLFNRVLGKEEDGRYLALREKWGENANRKFFWFFQFQAALVVFFSLPYAFVTLDSTDGLRTLKWTGAAIWVIGNLGVIASDWQLSRWRADPANKGKTARTRCIAWSSPDAFSSRSPPATAGASTDTGLGSVQPTGGVVSPARVLPAAERRSSSCAGTPRSPRGSGAPAPRSPECP